jgi:hypothetical protein
MSRSFFGNVLTSHAAAAAAAAADTADEWQSLSEDDKSAMLALVKQ